MKGIHEKLNEIKENIALKKVLEEKREKLNSELNLEKNILSQLRITLEKEQNDVEKLEKISLSSFIATLLQNKGEKVEKEHQEYLRAKLKYDEQASKVILIEGNLKSVEERLADLRNCEVEYRELLDKKVHMLKSSGNESDIIKLLSLEKDVDDALKAQKEIEEAEAVGTSLMGAIESAEDSLRSAENWGVWDMVGGDLFTSIAKHNRLDDAEASFIYISNLLQRFNKELGDIHVSSLSFSSATIAFDIFFDNIFTDFAVQKKIQEALTDTYDLKQRVEMVMNTLGQEKEEVKNMILIKRKEYDEFLEKL